MYSIHLNRLAAKPTKYVCCSATALALLFLFMGNVYAQVLWSTSHETGDVSDWIKGPLNPSGGVYNTGGSDARLTVTSEVARTGKYSVKMEVWNIDTQVRACRINRWGEHLRQGYFSCWLMFPVLPTTTPANGGWLNLFQFKKKNYTTEACDPTWYNELYTKSQGRVLTLTHWNQRWDIAPNVSPSLPIKANEWFHVEWYYKDGIADGEISIWLNGTLVWRLQNVNTRGIDPSIQWAPSLYGHKVTPGYLVMYMDDAVISTVRVGPDHFGASQPPSIAKPSAPRYLRVEN